MKKILLLIAISISIYGFSQTVKPSIQEENISEIADIAPDFPGGMNAFRNKVYQNFKTKKMAGDEGTLMAIARFYIDKNGIIKELNVSGSNAEFNKEIERLMKSIKTKWTPAKLKGESINYWMELPFTMNFE